MLRWIVLITGLLTTMILWYFSDKLTPLIPFPFTLGVIGYTLIYGYWAMAVLSHKKKASNVKLRRPSKGFFLRPGYDPQSHPQGDTFSFAFPEDKKHLRN